jgi:hypothetical protein
MGIMLDNYNSKDFMDQSTNTPVIQFHSIDC